MSTQVQYRRGTNAQNSAFTGALAEITVDTTNGTLRVHDGITAGGSNIATVSYVTAQISALSANSISSGTSNVRVVSSGGNVTTSVGGTSNVAVFATTGAYITGVISATGNITGAYILGNGSQLTGVDATSIQNGTSNVKVLTSNGNVSINVAGNSIVTFSTGGIENNIGNGAGNIGTASTYFNTVFAKATSAQYADLAEMYCADSNYTPGTVLDFGGEQEVTSTTTSHSTQIAGIVSTNPSYLMNSTLACTNAVEVALVGRVPCQVVGTIAKGDRLVASSIAGTATRLDMAQYQPGCIIGKALEAYDSETVGIIEVAVGRI